MQTDQSSSSLQDYIEDYWDIALGFISAIFAYYFHIDHSPYLGTFFAAISIIALSVTISEVAEILAERMGEPYGSFVLTFSAVAVEIVLLYMILASGNTQSVETVKSGIISAVIVDMNVLLGIAVFVGGLAFKEQEHNEETSDTYTTILFVSSIALLVPSLLRYTPHNMEQKLTEASIIISVILFLYYIIIYVFQTKTHSHFFKATARSRILRLKRRKNIEEEEIEENYLFEKLPNWLNLAAIFILIFIVGVIAELFAHDSAHIFSDFGITAGFAGLVIAIISVSPELITAVKAAKNDQIQRVVNIAMGASTVSILITVPSLMALAFFNHIPLTLDFNSLQIGALLLTVILAWKTTDNGETNYIEGISHLMFFICFAVIAALY